jgi:hypothetical protein
LCGHFALCIWEGAWSELVTPQGVCPDR